MSATPITKKASNTRMEGTFMVQRGQVMFLGAAPAHVLIPHTKIDTFDPHAKTGYQRDRAMSRARDAGIYYEKGGRMPNTLLYNVRAEDFADLGIEVDDTDGFNAALSVGGDWIGSGTLDVPVAVDLWLYDGQHREGGVEDLLGRDSSFTTFPIPVSITLGLTPDEEMWEFYEVNSNAKSVKTDLAWELIRKRYADDDAFALDWEVSGKEWIIRGQDVVDALLLLDGPWVGCIQMPNEKKVKVDRLVIPQAQFVRSLKPVLDMSLLAKAEPKKIAQIVNAYWKGIAKVLPEPFDPANNPKDWVIQKGPGAISLHRVLPQVIEVLRARGGQPSQDVDGYADILRDLPNLEGQVTDEETGVRTTISGEEFWRSGPTGVASGFTGDAGRKRLGVMIQSLLPKPSDEQEL